jgi:hypothetical protein
LAADPGTSKVSLAYRRLRQRQRHSKVGGREGPPDNHIRQRRRRTEWWPPYNAGHSSMKLWWRT